jgi:hypothetical protein
MPAHTGIRRPQPHGVAVGGGGTPGTTGVFTDRSGAEMGRQRDARARTRFTGYGSDPWIARDARRGRACCERKLAHDLLSRMVPACQAGNDGRVDPNEIAVGSDPLVVTTPRVRTGPSPPARRTEADVASGLQRAPAARRAQRRLRRDVIGTRVASRSPMRSR